jgi:CO/xanthine dehydrogenase Mo-binding subunit
MNPTTSTRSRRTLLKGTGALVVGFSLAGSLRSVAFAADEIPPNPSFSAEDQLKLSPDLDSWIQIAADGNVTFLTGRVEIGNGILTALSQIVAEELDVPFAAVSLISADTAIVPNQGITSATTTIGTASIATRQAAATARQVLLQLASEELGEDVGNLQVTDGVISAQDDPAIEISYGALIGGQKFEEKVDPDAALKSLTDYTIVGQSIPRIDIPAKLTAAPGDFQENVRVEGMRFARTLRAPAYGATLKSYDESVASMPGVVAVIPIHHPGDERLARVERLETMPGDFIAVVAETENQAIRAVDALRETVQWELGDELPATSDDVYDWLVANGRDLEVQDDHEVMSDQYLINREQARDVVSATYRVPYQCYAPMSPAWSLADVQGDRATIWSATQGPFQARWMVAQALGFEHDDQVQLIGGPSSGLYGRRDDYDQEADVEAAIISQEVGSPVRLQWSRSDEFVWGQYRPPQVMALEAVINDSGQIDGLQAQVWTAIRGLHPQGPTSAILDAPYELGPRSLTGYDAGPLLRTGWMRNVFRGNNIFALESLMDELAERAGADPVAFRLDHMTDERAVAVLEAAAQAAGWQEHTGNSGDGMGVCFALYNANPDGPSQTYLAYIAEVTVDEQSGEVHVHKVTAAIDCGLVVNPDGVANQVEGGVIQALSWMLKEEVTFDNQIVTSYDWITYPILTFPEVPEIEVVIVDRPDMPAKGIGEPVTVPVAAAVANAIYDAVGVRVRDLPLRPDRLLAALAEA